MSSGDSPVTSDAEFRTELKTLLTQAHDNGVTVEGGWDCRNGEDHPDWDIIVTEVEKPDE